MKYLLQCIFAVLISVALASVDNRPRIKLTRKGVYPATTSPSTSAPDTSTTPSVTTSDESDLEPQESKKPLKTKNVPKPDSLDGWLTEPKKQSASQTHKAPPGEKPGYCDHLQNYGIKCGIRMDQCKQDKDCPSVSKCCSVSDCGNMCVKPIEKLKPETILKKRGKEDLVGEESVTTVTTAEGLKLNDITIIPSE